MTDRLAELRRQRALVAEHLAWLDREIAAASPTTGASDVSAVPPVSSPAAVKTPALAPAEILAAAAATPGPDSSAANVPTAPSLPSLPETRPADIRQDVRRGCFVYFALAALLVLGGGALLVWASRAYNASHPPQPHRVEAR